MREASIASRIVGKSPAAGMRATCDRVARPLCVDRQSASARRIPSAIASRSNSVPSDVDGPAEAPVINAAGLDNTPCDSREH
jgi:hypothetical protein